jgi:hypothetical protein
MMVGVVVGFQNILTSMKEEHVQEDDLVVISKCCCEDNIMVDKIYSIC